MSTIISTARLGDSDVADVILGQSPPSSTYNERGAGLPFYQGKADFGLVHPTPRIWCSEGSKFARPGDVLMSVRAPVGDVNMATQDAVVGRGVSAIRPAEGVDPWYLYFSLTFMKPVLAAQATGSTFASVNGTTLRDLEIPFVPFDEQVAIGRLLRLVVTRIQQEETSWSLTAECKRAAMQQLFTRGLQGEAQKATEIGPIPESWSVRRLDAHADVLSTRMSYTELLGMMSSAEEAAVRVLGIKVSDMNTLGNEVELADAQLEVSVDIDVARARCAPPGAIIIPKRGAAIATNKKRIAPTWTVFDPNVIGIVARQGLNQRFLFHWFQTFDLRGITEPGPTPQLNKKNLEPLLLALPPSTDEQEEIVEVLDALDRKVELHRRKHEVLDQLFKSLLNKLMTGEVAVDDLDISALSVAEGSAI